MIAPLTRPSITNNPLPNHNFGRGPRINCLMTEEESEMDPSEFIYDLPVCFMITWEELMGMTSTTGYNICSQDVTKTTNYPTSINGGRHFKPQANYQAPTYGDKHFEPQSNDLTSPYGGRHFIPQDTDLNNLTKIAHIIRGETLQTPTFGDRQPNRSLEQIYPTNTY